MRRALGCSAAWRNHRAQCVLGLLRVLSHPSVAEQRLGFAVCFEAQIPPLLSPWSLRKQQSRDLSCSPAASSSLASPPAASPMHPAPPLPPSSLSPAQLSASAALCSPTHSRFLRHSGSSLCLLSPGAPWESPCCSRLDSTWIPALLALVTLPERTGSAVSHHPGSAGDTEQVPVPPVTRWEPGLPGPCYGNAAALPALFYPQK